MYSSAIFAGGRRVFSQILPGQGRPPSTILRNSIKTRDTGLPDGKKRIPLRSLVLHNTGV